MGLADVVGLLRRGVYLGGEVALAQFDVLAGLCHLGNLRYEGEEQEESDGGEYRAVDDADGWDEESCNYEYEAGDEVEVEECHVLRVLRGWVKVQRKGPGVSPVPL